MSAASATDGTPRDAPFRDRTTLTLPPRSLPAVVRLILRCLVVWVRKLTAWVSKSLLVADTVQAVFLPCRIRRGVHDWVAETVPCWRMNASGSRTAPRLVTKRTAPNCCSPTGALDRSVISTRRDWPGLSVNLRLENRTTVRDGRVARDQTVSFLPLTFTSRRAVEIWPGMVGALIDGMLRSIAFTGLAVWVAIAAPVSEIVSGAWAARPTSIRPAPMSKGSACVRSSSFSTRVIAEVIIADLICPGLQLGWSALSRMAAPAMCGADIEVPAIAW